MNANAASRLRNQTRAPRNLLAIALCAFALAAAGSGSAHAGTASENSWAHWAELETIEVLTLDTDGETRRRKIWLLVQDGRAYIRAGAYSTWGDNAVRADTLTVIHPATGETRSVRATAVQAEEARAQIIRGFRKKYGLLDAILNPMRGTTPRIWSLTPPPPPRGA